MSRRRFIRRDMVCVCEREGHMQGPDLEVKRKKKGKPRTRLTESTTRLEECYKVIEHTGT